MNRFRDVLNLRQCTATVVIGLVIAVAGCDTTRDVAQSVQENGLKATDLAANPVAQTDLNPTETQDKVAKTQTVPEWIGKAVTLFDGKSLDGWETIEFGGEGESTTNDGLLAFEAGDPFTGISSTRDSLPKTNYEVSLEARKMDGVDFFCGLTFPVADSHCTLIVGGWGGATVGLSCIDEKDASSNETCKFMKFEKEKWYKIRVRVEPATISVWIDGEQIVNQNIAGRKISLRGDTDLCKPMGICSFMTVAEYKNIQLRQFKQIEKPTKTDPNSTATKPKPDK